jgi:hypothetical protein
MWWINSDAWWWWWWWTNSDADHYRQRSRPWPKISTGQQVYSYKLKGRDVKNSHSTKGAYSKLYEALLVKNYLLKQNKTIIIKMRFAPKASQSSSRDPSEGFSNRLHVKTIRKFTFPFPMTTIRKCVCWVCVRRPFCCAVFWRAFLIVFT